MLLLKYLRWVWGAALAAALAFGATTETSGVDKQLLEGRQLRAQGRYAEARQAIDALLRDTQRVPPESHLAAVVLDELGMNEGNLGNYGEGETAFNRALAILHGSAADDPALSSVKIHLAELYLAEWRPADADPLLRQASAALRSAAPTDRVALAAAYNDLAVACVMLRKHQEAETLLRQAQALIAAEFGPDDPMVANSLVPLAGALLAQRRYDEAVTVAEQAWHNLQSASASVAEPDLAGVLNVLSVVYFHAGRTAEAESYGRQAVARAEAVLGPRHPRLGLYLANYAAILKRMGRKDQAKEMQHRADAILAQISRGAGHTISVDAMR